MHTVQPVSTIISSRDGVVLRVFQHCSIFEVPYDGHLSSVVIDKNIAIVALDCITLRCVVIMERLRHHPYLRQEPG